MRIDFVPTNPRHHAAAIAPVAAALVERGHFCRIVSACEVRGFSTEDGGFEIPGVDVIKLVPPVRQVMNTVRGLLPKRRSASPQPEQRANDPVAARSNDVIARARGGAQSVAKEAIEAAILGRLRWLWRSHRPDVVVVANDAAFPAGAVMDAARHEGVPVILLQEGIRFPLPSEAAAGRVYGGQDLAALCAWGEASATYFRTVAQAGTDVVATGTPRFDRPLQIQKKSPVRDDPTIGVLTNPIDDQGFVTPREKLALFQRLLEACAPRLTKGTLRILVRHHPGERRSDYQAAIDAVGLNDQQCQITDLSMNAFLSEITAGVVFASSVGLEVIQAGLRLGVLEVPGAGYVHDYVQAKVAVGIPAAPSADDVDDWLSAPDITPARRREYVESHLQTDHPARRIADVVENVHHQSRGGR